MDEGDNKTHSGGQHGPPQPPGLRAARTKGAVKLKSEKANGGVAWMANPKAGRSWVTRHHVFDQ